MSRRFSHSALLSCQQALLAIDDLLQCTALGTYLNGIYRIIKFIAT